MKKKSASLPPAPTGFGKPADGLRNRLYTIVFEADTASGRLFDLILIVAIIVSIFVVMLDSVQSIKLEHGTIISALEWSFTILFTIEYLVRLYSVEHPARYARSFFGIIDLLSIVPTYLALIFPEAHALLDVRILRLLRIFRILKLTMYVAEYQMLVEAVSASRRKILVFLSVVMMVVVVMGTIMYVVEGPEHGFTSIPRAIYWAIVTLTTVGYGDMTPQTNLGKVIASMMMLLGWGTLAVPTGIVTAEMTSRRMMRYSATRTCPACKSKGHEHDAAFCKDCGASLLMP